MAKSIYCIGKIKGGQRELLIAESNDDKAPSKRVEIVSLKMVRESSILYKNRKISSPKDAVDMGAEFLQDADREKLLVCCLDTKNQPTIINFASEGSLNASIVHPREVFKVAVLGNAASIIIFHNHPSGDPSPSQEDINITNRLKEAGKILGIDLLDHIIIGEEGRYCSLKERGIV